MKTAKREFPTKIKGKQRESKRHVPHDLDAVDLLRALIGIANVATSPDWQQSARRLVDILITGSRPIKGTGI